MLFQGSWLVGFFLWFLANGHPWLSLFFAFQGATTIAGAYALARRRCGFCRSRLMLMTHYKCPSCVPRALPVEPETIIYCVFDNLRSEESWCGTHIDRVEDACLSTTDAWLENEAICINCARRGPPAIAESSDPK